MTKATKGEILFYENRAYKLIQELLKIARLGETIPLEVIERLMFSKEVTESDRALYQHLYKLTHDSKLKGK